MQRMDSKVFWQRDISLAKLKTFQGDLQEVDVAVAGGGLVGLLTALLLKKAGHRVALFEARVIGDGVTARSTAKVTALHGTRCSEIEKMHGLDAARLYAQLNHQAVDELENLVRAYHVDCGWTRQDAYTFAETSQEDSRVRREADILAEAGL